MEGPPVANKFYVREKYEVEEEDLSEMDSEEDVNAVTSKEGSESSSPLDNYTKRVCMRCGYRHDTLCRRVFFPTRYFLIEQGRVQK